MQKLTVDKWFWAESNGKPALFITPVGASQVELVLEYSNVGLALKQLENYREGLLAK